MSNWNIFSNHGHVLFYLARDPDARLRDVAANVGITERAVQKIVRDMQDAGVLEVIKQGRRNAYRIDHAAALRHDLESHCTVGQLISLLVDRRPAARAEAPAAVVPAQKPKPSPEPQPPVQPPPPEPTPVPGKSTRQAKPQPQEDKPSSDASTAEQGSLF